MKISYHISEKDYLEYKIKFLARRKINAAVRKGLIKRAECCEVCDKRGPVDAHHIDYARPIDVTWLCEACHGESHRKGSILAPQKMTRSAACYERLESAPLHTNVPFATFACIKRIAEQQGVTVAHILRQAIMERYPVENDSRQLMFNYNGHDDRHSDSHGDSHHDDQKAQKVSAARKARQMILPGLEQLLRAV